MHKRIWTITEPRADPQLARLAPNQNLLVAEDNSYATEKRKGC